MQVEEAFQAWAKASGLTFQEVAAGAPADINVGFSELDPAATNLIGQTQYKSEDGQLEAGVQVALADPNQAPLSINAHGQLAYASTDVTFEQVVMHEIGHALGLADTGQAGSIMNAVLGTGNQTLSDTDITTIRALYSSIVNKSANPIPTAAHAIATSHSSIGAIGSASAREDAVMALPDAQTLVHAMAVFSGDSAATGSGLIATPLHTTDHIQLAAA